MKIRALVDIPCTDIKSGEFFEVEDIQVPGLVAGGYADDQATEVSVYGTEIPPAKALTFPVPGIAEAVEAPADDKKKK